METPWSVVFESDHRGTVNDRALVLQSQSIPFQVADDEARVMLLVHASNAERARYELYLYETENRRPKRLARQPLPPAQNGIPGVIAYVVVLCTVAWMAGENAFGFDWLAAGRVDGALIRDGEWWRAMTALTLHSGLRHLLGNVAFGVFFGLVAGRLLGSGLTWLTVVLASGAANLLNTILLESTHRSIGASTAVFATLGLVAGFVWRSKLMAQDRWAYRLGPVVGGIALLAYTGTGEADTDIGAHLSGFICGFGSGIILTLFSKYSSSRRRQQFFGAAAIGLLVAAWLLAF